MRNVGIKRVNATVVGSVPCRGIKYILIFSLSDNEAKRDIEFHSVSVIATQQARLQNSA